MEVRIYSPSKNPMQSGRATTGDWIVEFEPAARPDPDPLMGWNGSTDTRGQVRLTFDTREEAIAHAERNGWTYTVYNPKVRRIRPKAYADNFAVSRTEPWTH